MTKSALRRHFLAQRRALSAAEVAHRSLAITERFFGEFFTDLVQTNRPILHTFLPIARQNEVDTWPIINRIWQHFPHLQVAVSVADTATSQLSHYVLTPATLLVENRWGIPEPVDAQSISSAQIDVVLVPLVAFDTYGHRVGYGKGYYDRFLADTRPDCLKVGLSLFDPVEQITDVEPTDVPLNACITPKEIWWFGALFHPKNTP